MKDIQYILIVALAGVCLGMASVPKQPTASISFTQRITPYVNALIQNCVEDCQKTNLVGQDCNKECTDFAVFTTGEYHDQIINKMGNVL